MKERRKVRHQYQWRSMSIRRLARRGVPGWRAGCGCLGILGGSSPVSACTATEMKMHRRNGQAWLGEEIGVNILSIHLKWRRYIGRLYFYVGSSAYSENGVKEKA